LSILDWERGTKNGKKIRGGEGGRERHSQGKNTEEKEINNKEGKKISKGEN